MSIEFYPIERKYAPLANVIVNGKETNWYVEKAGNFYNILWGRADCLYSFASQSWFSSESKEEIKEKLQESVFKPVEIRESIRGFEYVYQD